MMKDVQGPLAQSTRSQQITSIRDDNTEEIYIFQILQRISIHPDAQHNHLNFFHI